MQNTLKRIISEKGNAVGTFLCVSTPAIVEDISYSGLDFVLIDTEHGTYDLSAAGDMIRAADARGLCPLIRVSDPTHREIQHAVDNGAEGIIIPYLRDVEDFRKVVELGKFAPTGNRGFIKGRGSGFGNEPWANGTLEEYMRNSNDKVLLIPQCETAEALENIEAIAAIDGIDGIFVGPFDLSICMDIPGQFDHPRFCSAIDRILSACRKAGKLCMIFTSTPEEARRYLDKGFHAVANNLDAAVIAQAFRAMVRSIRE